VSGPPILGPIDEPDPTRYEPREVASDVEGAKDLLLFCRAQGIRFDVLRVGNVAIAGIVDDYPRKRVSSAPPRPPGEPDDDMREFEE
jgi:hypothetical protein